VFKTYTAKPIGGITASPVLGWIAKRHWWFIGLLALLLIFGQYFDVIRKLEYVHVIEGVVYLVLLLMIGALFDLLLRVIKVRTKFINILKFKHKLSLEFSVYSDWDVLATQIARFPGTVADVEKSFLFVLDPISNQFEPTAQWPVNDIEGAADLHFPEDFQERLQDNPDSGIMFQKYESSTSSGASSESTIYCLPIQYGKSLLGVVQFKLKPGKTLSGEQEYLFNNISDEFAFILKAGQERRKYYQMAASETALAERRKVSRYLHDHLGHNLSYLHFKLDQLVSMEDQDATETIADDLEHMREAAHESYEIVRGTLETIRPETAPLLTNLLLEHARKISQRANFEIDFKTLGKAAVLPIEVNRAIFYVFEEALSNIEKYANASKVNVLAEWNEDCFTLTISDNGIGFDPENVNADQHFGLEILHERIDKVRCQVTLSTSESEGTTVFVRVPKPFMHQIMTQ
jgi:signal transduction histidine kinase